MFGTYFYGQLMKDILHFFLILGILLTCVGVLVYYGFTH
jgi:hypothetical protein